MTTSPIPGLPPDDDKRNWIGESADGRQWVLRYRFSAWDAYGPSRHGDPIEFTAKDIIIKSHISPVQPAGIDKEGGNMAEFCNQCCKDNGFELGELAGITKPEDWAEGKSCIVICEGCGIIQVDPDGNCISIDCAFQHGLKP